MCALEECVENSWRQLFSECANSGGLDDVFWEEIPCYNCLREEWPFVCFFRCLDVSECLGVAVSGSRVCRDNVCQLTRAFTQNTTNTM